ncbi:MAG: DUF4388 domain-containing protein [Nitrospirae bacterium]|nr:DUF4388 domain-containing protein [Nitrospirota bacterium]
MKGIKGQLSSLPVSDLMQWIEMNRKSGMLIISGDKKSTCFCFKEGSVLLASFNEDGKRFGDYLVREAHIEAGKIKEILSISRDKKASFISYLADNKIVSEDFIKAILEQVSEFVLVDILGWQEGSFQFIEALPDIIGDSPVRLNTSHLVFESVRKYDESLREKSSSGA